MFEVTTNGITQTMSRSMLKTYLNAIDWDSITELTIRSASETEDWTPEDILAREG